MFLKARQIFLSGMKVHRSGGAVMLRPISLLCAGVRILCELLCVCVVDRMCSQFPPALDLSAHAYCASVGVSVIPRHGLSTYAPHPPPSDRKTTKSLSQPELRPSRVCHIQPARSGVYIH